MSQPTLSQQREWSRFFFHTSPEVSNGIEALVGAAVEGVSGKEGLSEQELGFLHLCAREFYLTGEVVAVPQDVRLPAIIYPGQVGLVARADGKFLLHWDNNGSPQTLPPETIYLRRPANPFDIRGVPAVSPEGVVVEPSGFEAQLFSRQVGVLVDLLQRRAVDHVVPEEDDPTGEEDATS